MKIIKIDVLTIFILITLVLSGYIKIGLIIFLIVLIHELGHVTISFILKYKVKKITIYPFGGITILEKDINTPIKNELLIASGGIFFQILLLIVVMLLPLSINTKEIFYKYNLSIILFNILPIIPLDGSIILKSILNKYLSFKRTYILSIIISIIFIIGYLLFNYWYSLNNYFIVMLFIYKMYESIKDYKYIYNKFLLERYLKKYKFNNISTKVGNIDILKLDTYQYFKNNNSIVSEKKKLQEIFDK